MPFCQASPPAFKAAMAPSVATLWTGARPRQRRHREPLQEFQSRRVASRERMLTGSDRQTSDRVHCLFSFLFSVNAINRRFPRVWSRTALPQSCFVAARYVGRPGPALELSRCPSSQ